MSVNLEQVAKLADQLSSAEQLRLVEHLAQRLQRQTNASQGQPQDLYGIWRGKFSDNLDFESALQEVRSEWKNDFEDLVS